MKNLSIRPLARFIAQHPQTHLTKNDLRQLQAKLQRQYEKKLATPRTDQKIPIEKKYIEILDKLVDSFSAQTKISKKELEKAGTAILKSEGFDYRRSKRKARYGNTFHVKSSEIKYYDLAFFNEALPNPTRGDVRPHHVSGDLASIFYMRCEEDSDQPEAILFGNLQRERYPREYWLEPEFGDVLTAKKNLDQEMVQQAVRYALEKKKTQLRFHTGAAMSRAQWRENKFIRLDVTPENYKEYQANYEKRCEEFERITPGTIIEFNQKELVYEKTSQHFKAYEEKYTSECMLGALYENLAGNSFDINTDERYWIGKAYLAFCDKAAAKVHENLATLFSSPPRNSKPPPPPVPAQIEYIDKLISQQKSLAPKEFTMEKFQTTMQEFLQKFNYNDGLATIASKLCTLRINGRVYYLAKETYDKPNIYKREALVQPKIGKDYYRRQDVFKFTTLKEAYKYVQQNHRDEIYTWYETRLPEILKSLGLTVKRVEIETSSGGNQLVSFAWEVVDGLAEFKKNALVRFAAGTDLKMDIVPRPALYRAAKKFGLLPGHLEILNDYVISPTGGKGTGAYAPATDTITVTNQSLARVAHEGWHRLVQQGLVPKKEYRAVVAAGRRLAAQNPRWTERLKEKDPQGNYIYNTPATRAEEFGALFVETYYEKENIARKQLMGAKLTVTEKVLGYMRTARDIIQSAWGYPPARARRYLRQVELDLIAAPPKTRPAPKFYPQNLSKQR